MHHDDQGPSPEVLLDQLDQKGADPGWLRVADVLTGLERKSRRGPDGRAWLEIVREHLEALGHPRTTGHLRKMRRAYAFLQTAIASRDKVPDEDALERVALTALETAERIARLDPEAGQAAIDACLNGATAAKLEALYAQVRTTQAAQLTPRQLAWEARREGQRTRGARAEHLMAIEESLSSDPKAWWDFPDAAISSFSAGTFHSWLRSDEDTWLILTTAAGEHRLGGARLVRMTRGDAKGWRQLLEGVLMRASLVDRFWVILEADQAETDRFREWLDTLRVPNLCLARATLAGPEPVERLRLSDGTPAPDRRGLLLSALLRRRS